jgi:hypothetical protein
MDVVGEGTQGFWLGARGGEEIVSMILVSIGTMGCPEFFDVDCLMPYFSMKKYGGGMILVCYKTNLGVGHTMVSLNITENTIIKVLLAILGSWRWGPNGGPDLWRYYPHTLSSELRNKSHVGIQLFGSSVVP